MAEQPKNPGGRPPETGLLKNPVNLAFEQAGMRGAVTGGLWENPPVEWAAPVLEEVFGEEADRLRAVCGFCKPECVEVTFAQAGIDKNLAHRARTCCCGCGCCCLRLLLI